MSATNRTEGQRVANDVYSTPPWSVQRLLDQLAMRELPVHKFDGKPVHWLEPCAGDGQLIRAANAWLEGRGQAGTGAPSNVRWHACELRPECEESLKAVANPVIIGDFLRVVPANYDVVLTNPPYSLAEEFVRACLPVSTHVVMLLRLGWLERHDELLAQHPADVWVLPDRPPFGRDKHGKVGTDAAAYAWFHWYPGATGRVRHLARTPKAVRSAYRKWLDETLPKKERTDGRADRASAAEGTTPVAPEAADGQQPVDAGVPRVERVAEGPAAPALDVGPDAGAVPQASDSGGTADSTGSGDADGDAGPRAQPEEAPAAGTCRFGADCCDEGCRYG